MFVQVVRGVVRDPEDTFARLDIWLQRLAPGAQGWLGTTAGVTRDRELVSFVRFASAVDARRNSDRIEQAQWWAESAKTFAGDVSFDNYDEVTLFGDGGSDAAALVEVLVGRVPRRRSTSELAAQLAARSQALPPRAIGGMVGLHGDGHFTQAVYFCHAVLEPVGGPRDRLALAGGATGTSQHEFLRLEHLWFGSPEGAIRRHPADEPAAEAEPQVRELDPAGNAEVAEVLLALQRASYRLEADLIGDDRIPALREGLAELRTAGLTWRGVFEHDVLLGAVAWTETASELDIHRLVVDPGALRRGLGRRLVCTAVDRADHRRTVVATGRANDPARRLYEGLGFVHRADVEVLPGLWVSELVRPSGVGGRMATADADQARGGAQ